MIKLINPFLCIPERVYEEINDRSHKVIEFLNSISWSAKIDETSTNPSNAYAKETDQRSGNYADDSDDGNVHEHSTDNDEYANSTYDNEGYDDDDDDDDDGFPHDDGSDKNTDDDDDYANTADDEDGSNTNTDDGGYADSTDEQQQTTENSSTDHNEYEVPDILLNK